MTGAVDFDVIIIGSGAGGSALAYGLASSGIRIGILERGDYIPREDANWDPVAVFQQRRYRTLDRWHHVEAAADFAPGIHHCVGGNTKFFGAALTRPRISDFSETHHQDGISPAWPVAYDVLEPWLSRAETVMGVHGELGEDPGEPFHSERYPFPAIPHEPYVQRLHHDLKRQGLFPFHLPMGIDLRPEGRCIRCRTCDAFICKVDAKSDAETRLLQPALTHSNVTLLTNTRVTRIVTDPDGNSVRGVEALSGGTHRFFSARIVVVACGAAYSAALLLASVHERWPEGLANSSGLIGRHYMAHNAALLMAINPLRQNDAVYQKTLCLNDWYESGSEFPFPLGTAQLVGKVTAPILKSALPGVPMPILRRLAERSHEWWLLTEDLPRPENRIEWSTSGQIRLHYKPNNTNAQQQLIDRMRRALKRAGFPLIVSRKMGVETTSHQGGTARFGSDPKTSVLNLFCRTHDVENLYVVDASFFPSLPAMGLTLTIVAQALRVADHIRTARLPGIR